MQFSANEQNLAKWAVLLHDIAKRGSPELIGKDHVHPFMSGKAVLELFKEKGLIKKPV